MPRKSPESFLPLRSVKWGAIFGEALRIHSGAPEREAREAFVATLRTAYDRLFAELRAAIGFRSVA